MSTWEVVHGECVTVMELCLGDASIDLVLTDLPYGTTACAWDSIIPFAPMWAQYRRVCRGPIVLTAQTPFDKALAMSNIGSLKYEWIWEKTLATGHLNAKKMPLKAHENVLVFYDKLPTYNPQKTTGHVRKTATKRHDITEVYGAQAFAEITYDSTERYPRSVITFASDKQRSTLHSTQKPIALMEYLIRTYTNKGDTVLDSCAGSGTTGVACVNAGRNFIGIELSARDVEIARERIALAQVGDLV